MGTIDPALIKFYAAVASDGGGINLSALQTSSVVGNEISEITTAERTAGAYRYVKQFVLNENAGSFGPFKVYLSSQTQYSPNTNIAFAISGSKSRIQTASALSGTAVFTATGYITTSNDLRQEVASGEKIYNSTNDSALFGVEVLEVASNYIQLSAGYAGTYGSGKAVSVCPATTLTFISPMSASDVVCPVITLEQAEALAIWKRYEVVGGCPQFENDWFTFNFEEI